MFSAPARIAAALALINTLLPSVANAAHVQWVRCPDGKGGTQGFEDLWPTSRQTRLILDNSSVHGGTSLKFDVTADYMGEATCAELLQEEPSDVTIKLDAMDLSETYVYVVRPLNWTCLPYEHRPVFEQQHLANRESQIRFTAKHDLPTIGLLPAFSTQVYFSASNKSDPATSSACMYSEVTPQLRKEVTMAARYGPVAVFLLVLLSGLFATLCASPVSLRRRPSVEAGGGNTPQYVVVQRAILPGVGDCLLHLQFIFFMGALTLRYPGFYQPLTSLLHWSALFSPMGPFGQDLRYNSVKDGIYEVNGTLTGSYGLELMSQITGGPMTMDVWRNMVFLAAIISALVGVFMMVHKYVSQLRPSLLSFADKGPDGDGEGQISDSAIARGTWNVLRVVLSYFLTPIVAISAYQLDNVILPAYHLALASLLIVLVVVGLTWMWRIAPSNQLWVLLVDSSKRYRRVRTDDSDSDGDSAQPGEKRDIFAIIFFGLAFARGIAVGGLQFSPVAQVVVLAVTELALLVSTAVLRPMRRRVLSVFTWSGIARLVVVGLTAAFIPELNASILARSRVGIAILVIHVAVLVLGCAVPATIRLVSLVWSSCTPADDEPEIYGLSQLRRRSDAVNNLSIPGSIYSARPDSPVSYRGHNPRSPSDASSINFYHDQNSPPDTLYLRAVPQHHYFRQPRSSSSSAGSLRRAYAASSANTNPFSLISPPSSEQNSSSSSEGEAGGSPISTTTISRVHRHHPLSTSDSASSASSEDTFSNTPEPLQFAPQRSDYAFREADLYYGHGRPQRVQTFGYTAADAAEDAPQQQQQASTVRRVVSSIREQLTGRRSVSVKGRAENRGFEVRRPARPAGLGGV